MLKCEKIETAEDFVDFALLVNAGKDEFNEIVSLENEIDFDGCDRAFVPIGTNENCFNKSFDGKGHAIKNLMISVTGKYGGLFGKYCGTSIKNVVLDESCSITVNSYHGCSVGGIVGLWAGSGTCIDPQSCGCTNCTMNGCTSNAKIIVLETSEVVTAGGLIGKTESVNLEMTDCVNYGEMSVAGDHNHQIGGIIGEIGNCNNAVVKHSVFNGNIFYLSPSQSPVVGGFVGKSNEGLTNLTNCFNGGFTNSTKNNVYSFIGGKSTIPGSCFVTSCSSGFIHDKSYSTELSPSESEEAIIEGNNLTTLHFDSCITSASDRKNLPSLKNGNHTFSVWCIDPKCSEVYDVSMGYREELWGVWDSYKVTLIYRNKTTKVIAVEKGNEITHPFYKDGLSPSESWYYENGIKYEGGIVTEDLVLYAKSNNQNNKIHISTSTELCNFGESVSKNDGYRGTTVYIENDINMIACHKFKPIEGFVGTFDGKGNAIKNLKISSKDTSVGLFGNLSDDAVIRNLVLDSSCSITYDESSRRRGIRAPVKDIFVGGIAGGKGKFKISNVINEAKITAKGSGSSAMHVGGLVGSCDGCTIEDSTNKGEVTGEGVKDMGGIVGKSKSGSISGVANYGRISGSEHIGGIAGRTERGSLTKAVNTGNISDSQYPMGIVGNVTNTSISSTFWEGGADDGFGGDTGVNRGKPFGDDYKGIAEELGEDWVSNINEYTVTFYIDGEEYIKMAKKLFKLPTPKSEGMTFCGWYKDKDFKTNFTGNTINEDDQKLYGKWDDYENPDFVVEIHFDTRKIGSKEKEVEAKILAFKDDNDNFRIVKFEDGDSEGITSLVYIVKFVDASETGVRNFVDKIQADEDLNEKIVSIGAYDAVSGDSIIDKGPKNAGAIIGIVIGTCVLVIIIVVAFAVFMYRFQENRNKRWVERLSRSRIVTNFNSELIREDAPASGVFKKPHTIYPQDYHPPNSMKEALTNSGMEAELADEVVEACDLNITLVNPNQEYPSGFNRVDAMAVAMYTFDFGNANYDLNPYRLLNAALASQNVEEVKKVRDLLYVVMTSLRRMPVVRGMTLYRGIRSSIDMSVHKVGAVISWPAFSSTTPNMKTTKAFLTKQVRETENEVELEDGEQLIDGNTQLNGTMFVIEDAWGYDIQPYSFYQDEEEILLEPGQQFRVEGVVDGDKFTLITLKMIDTPQILPDRFGRIQE